MAGFHKFGAAGQKSDPLSALRRLSRPGCGCKFRAPSQTARGNGRPECVPLTSVLSRGAARSRPGAGVN